MAQPLRAHALSVGELHRQLGVDYIPPTAPSFSDVPTGFWCYKYMEYAVEHDIVGGYGDGTRQPELPLARGQIAVFICRAFHLPM